MGFDYAPPKYAQVVAEIKARIERGDYPPGSLLPSEHQLVAEFGVSRPTIVKSLSALRQDGWIDTQQGKGSFVRGRPALDGAERSRPGADILQVPEADLSGELVQAGADPIRLAQDVYYSVPASKIVLLGVALNSLQREGRLAWLWITLEDMERAGAAEEDCEGIVNFALSIAGVEAAVFLRELTDGQIRLSLRSKGAVNVAAIAERLDGGGHENAAGCTLEGPLERALDQILAELRPALAAL